MTADPAPGETLKLLPESIPVLRFVYISGVGPIFAKKSLNASLISFRSVTAL